CPPTCPARVSRRVSRSSRRRFCPCSAGPPALIFARPVRQHSARAATGMPLFGLFSPGGEERRMLISWLRGKSPKSARKKIRRRPAPLILRTETLEDRAVPSATLVRDINTHTGASLGYSFGDASKSVELNGRLFFFADDGVHGRELWSTDGTDAG